MQKLIFTFLLLIITSNSFSGEPKGELSLEAIFSTLQKNEISNTLKAIEENPAFDKKSRQISLANKVEIFSADKFEKVKWTVSELSEDRKQFSLSIPIGGYSFKSSLSTLDRSKTVQCDENGASSGTKIIYFEKTSSVVAESWSCGSSGCSYEFIFSENILNNLKHFCQ